MPLRSRRNTGRGRWQCTSQPSRDGIGCRIMKSRTYRASDAEVPRNLSLPKPIMSRKSSQRTRKAATGWTGSASNMAASETGGDGEGSSGANQPASSSKQSHGMDSPKTGSNER